MTGVMLLPVSAAEVDGWPSDDRSPPHVGRNDGSEPSPFGDTINEEDQSSCDRPVIEKPQSLQLDKSPTWVASRSDSSYSWSSSVSNASDGAGRCLQSQLADRCRLLRKRRDYDPLIQWW